MRILLLLTAVLTSLLLVACGSEAAEPTGTPAAASGPGLSIAEAESSSLTGPLLVNGNLLVEGGEVRLCETLAESFPPQCGGGSLLVEGLDLGTVEGLTTSLDTSTGRKVSWTDRPIQLLGVVRDGTIAVSNNATA